MCAHVTASGLRLLAVADHQNDIDMARLDRGQPVIQSLRALLGYLFFTSEMGTQHVGHGIIRDRACIEYVIRHADAHPVFPKVRELEAGLLLKCLDDLEAHALEALIPLVPLVSGLCNRTDGHSSRHGCLPFLFYRIRPTRCSNSKSRPA